MTTRWDHKIGYRFVARFIRNKDNIAYEPGTPLWFIWDALDEKRVPNVLTHKVTEAYVQMYKLNGGA